MANINERILSKLKEYDAEVAGLAGQAVELAMALSTEAVEEQLNTLIRRMVREREAGN